MCFSASASFTAGTALSVIGVAALRITHASSERPFAMIPLLFGIQQLTEGVIWLTSRHDASLLKRMMTDLYSGFSHVLWPIYVPFAMGVIETVRWHKKAIFAFEAAGVGVGLYPLYILVTRPVVTEVVGGHIVYNSPHFYVMPMMLLYLAATCVSCFFSSHGRGDLESIHLSSPQIQRPRGVPKGTSVSARHTPRPLDTKRRNAVKTAEGEQ